MKKWFILTLLSAVLVFGGILGYNAWYQKTHVVVEETAYEKEVTFLDLRGTGSSMEHYEELRKQLPDCEIRYDLPFQGGFYADDTTEITVTSLTGEEVELLDYLPQLQTVHAEGCTDYDQLMALQERRPECLISYTVTIGEEDYPQDTTQLDFGKKLPDLDELTQVLHWLPELESVSFRQPKVPAADLVALMDTYPDIRFAWEKDAFGETYSSDVMEIDLSGLTLSSLDEVEEAMAYFPALEKVILCDCGTGPKEPFDHEMMAAFREKMRPEYKVVWSVNINGMKVRTDETYFMPAKYNKVVTNFQVQNLKYCEDMVCVDLGHMAITDISFVEGMPHLKYFIVIDSPLMFIDSISTCKELIYLEFFWNQINDFTPLLGCTALQDLNVSRNIGDPMVFTEMPWLKNLWIDGSDVRSDEKPVLEEALPDTYIKYCDGEMTANGWRDLQNYFDMRDYLGMPYNTW